jgi:hypothetical protein
LEAVSAVCFCRIVDVVIVLTELMHQDFIDHKTGYIYGVSIALFRDEDLLIKDMNGICFIIPWQPLLWSYMHEMEKGI